MRKQKWNERWDLSSIPEKLWMSEHARRKARKRWDAYEAAKAAEGTIRKIETVEEDRSEPPPEN